MTQVCIVLDYYSSLIYDVYECPEAAEKRRAELSAERSDMDMHVEVREVIPAKEAQ